MKYWLLLWCVLGVSVQAAELKGVGVFQTLNKPWFMAGLYAQPDNQVVRLDFRVVEEKISPYRFRQLWLEAFAVAHGDRVWQQHRQDLEAFFDLLYGPLQSHDQLVLEQGPDETVVSINYREHVRLSAQFLPLMVETLTARIASVPELRAGLLGELPIEQQRRLLREYDRFEPSLGRIAETSRWLRRRQQQAAADHSGSVTQL